MSQKKSLGANPLGSKRNDAVLRATLQAAAKASPDERRAPVALVLSGRGAEAAFEAGVAGALAASGEFEAKIVTGVSVGALNAAVLAADQGDLARATARLRAIWFDELAGDPRTGRNGFYRSRGDPRALLEPRRLPGALADFVGDGSHWVKDALRHGARALRAGDDLAPRLLWLADLGAMLSLEPFAALVAKVVNLEGLRTSRRQLRIASADWATGRVDIRDGAGLASSAGHDRIVAAAARPGIFPCVEIDGAPHVEATAFATSDLAPAIEAGAGELHVPVFLARRSGADRPVSTIDAFDRLLAELHLARFERELAELRARRPRPITVHLYRGRLGPSESHGFLDLRPERIAALIEHGREVVARHDCAAAGCLIGDPASSR